MKDIEKRDQVLTSDQQIDRLTKAGSKYLNLNPYEVCFIIYNVTWLCYGIFYVFYFWQLKKLTIPVHYFFNVKVTGAIYTFCINTHIIRSSVLENPKT